MSGFSDVGNQYLIPMYLAWPIFWKNICLRNDVYYRSQYPTTQYFSDDDVHNLGLPRVTQQQALSLILNDTSKATKTILRNPVRHLSKFHENLVYRTFKYYIYYLSSSGCAYPTQLDTQNEATTPISGPEELWGLRDPRVQGVPGSQGSKISQRFQQSQGFQRSQGSALIEERVSLLCI